MWHYFMRVDKFQDRGLNKLSQKLNKLDAVYRNSISLIAAVEQWPAERSYINHIDEERSRRLMIVNFTDENSTNELPINQSKFRKEHQL